MTPPRPLESNRPDSAWSESGSLDEMIDEIRDEGFVILTAGMIVIDPKQQPAQSGTARAAHPHLAFAVNHTLMPTRAVHDQSLLVLAGMLIEEVAETATGKNADYLRHLVEQIGAVTLDNHNAIIENDK